MSTASPDSYCPTMEKPFSQVQLSISARNLRDRDIISKSDPMCVVFMMDSLVHGNGKAGKYKEFGRTECIKNDLNPVFAKKIIVNYFFEESQNIKFEIYDVDSASHKLSDHDFLGSVETTLGEIIGSPSSRVTKFIKGTKNKSVGELTIVAEEIDTGGPKEFLHLELRGVGLDKKDLFGKSDPFLNFYRINADGSHDLAYRTEVIKNTLDPEWKRFTLNTRQLSPGGDRNTSIFVECFDYDNDGGHDLIGTCKMTIEELVGQRNAKFPLINEKKKEKKGKKYTNSGQLIVVNANTQRQYTFLEFITGGTQLDFTVAVDFTASNGAIQNPSSLHFINAYSPNQYQIAIRSVAEICQYYNHSKRFMAYGFGAKIPPHNAVSFEFPLDVHSGNPAVVHVAGLLEAYSKCLHACTLYGPTNFAPIIDSTARRAAQLPPDGSRYCVLLIITDGVITDMAKTRAAIVNASALPLSIIIVGVGNDEFEAMDKLDSDDKMLTAGGRVASRDIVQFVPLRKVLPYDGCHDEAVWNLAMARLAKEVLAEIPEQLTSYMRSRNIAPRPSHSPFPPDPTPIEYPTLPMATGFIQQPQSQPAAPIGYGYGHHNQPMPPPQNHSYQQPQMNGYPTSNAPSYGINSYGQPPYPQQYQPPHNYQPQSPYSQQPSPYPTAGYPPQPQPYPPYGVAPAYGHNNDMPIHSDMVKMSIASAPPPP